MSKVLDWLRWSWLRYKGTVAFYETKGWEIHDKQLSRLDSRLKAYKRIAGLALIAGTVYAWLQGNTLHALVMACTLHLHIVANYQFKKLAGIPIWQKQQTEQNSSKTG